MMKINRREISNICLLQIEGEIVAEQTPHLKQAIQDAVHEFAKSFVLDLNGVTFIDSTGLGVFIALMRQLKEMNGHLRLVGLQEEVRSIFEITRLFRVFNISKNLESALQEIQGAE